MSTAPTAVLRVAIGFVSISCASLLYAGSAPSSGGRELAQFMPKTWKADKFVKTIWVSPAGNGDGTSRSSALRSIQAAISKTEPGTLILVTAGTYDENLTISRDAEAANGSDEHPIFLVSADGCGAALVRSGQNLTTLDANRIQNWAVIGFQFVAASSLTDGDQSPFKVGSSGLLNGEPCRNWLVAGNTFSGTGHDGSKAYNARNISWLGNHYEGAWGQEACDNVAVGVTDVSGDSNRFAYNTVGGGSGYSAITVKYGSNHFDISHNDFKINPGNRLPRRGAMIRVGGNGELQRFASRIPYKTEAAFDPLTASYVLVSYNRFSGLCGINVELYGSRDSVVSFNDLTNPQATIELTARTADLGKDAEGMPYLWEPVNIRVTDNKITSAEENKINGELGGKGFLVKGNRADIPFDTPVGADAIRSEIDALIKALVANAH
ncbi:MAG: hypothetical protein HZA32_20425 [Opitutae bacterium]|nr:hypothetical protein [Opitutae bacterium]